MITRDQVLSRIQALEQIRQKLVADLNAVTGQLNECHFFLSQLETGAAEGQSTEGDTHAQ